MTICVHGYHEIVISLAGAYRSIDIGGSVTEAMDWKVLSG